MRLRRHPPRFPLALAALVAWLPLAALATRATAAGPGPREAQGEELAALERAVDEVDDLVFDAHFRTAIAVAAKTRDWAGTLPSSPEVRETRARLEVLCAGAQVAVGQEPDARASLARALAIWPLLSLSARDTSPRVVRIFRDLRARPAARSATP